MSYELEEDELPPPLMVHGIFTPLAAATIQPPRWVIDGVLPIGITFIGGPPKSEKSTATAAISAMVAGWKCAALPPFMRNVKLKGKTLWLSGEAQAGELKDMMVNGLNVEIPSPDDDSILVADDPWEFRLDDPDALNRLLKWLNDVDPRVAILDPLRNFHELDEKDAGDMNRLLRPIRKWAVENDAAFIVVHHSSKPGENHSGTMTANDLRGSSAIFGIADGVLMFTPKGKSRESIHIDAVFKRGAAWQQTVTFGSYGKRAGEVLTQEDEDVLSCLKAGAPTVESIAKQVHLAKATVIEVLKRLERNELARKEGKRWRAVR